MADFPPAHPGDVLREDFLKPLKLSQYALPTKSSVAARPRSEPAVESCADDDRLS